MTHLKKILILTADAGFGQRSAANAIAAALEERWADRAANARRLGKPEAAYEAAELAWKSAAQHRT